MVDRASTFSDPQIIELLQEKYVPVAIDQWYQRKQRDAEGDFYRKVAGQGPRNDFNDTTQGFYVATAEGQLLGFNNNRGSERVLGLLERSLNEFRPGGQGLAALKALTATDPRYARQPPEGGLVVRVMSKVLGGYDEPDREREEIFQSAIGRDNLWIRGDEHQALVEGRVPDSLATRIARFHLIDNTRGEPPMWAVKDIRRLELTLNEGRLRGSLLLETSDGRRGYEAELLGFVESEGDKVTRFDVVAKGQFWGEGRYTRGAPKGKFPLAIAFKLADGQDLADGVPPQGTKGWLASYLDPR